MSTITVRVSQNIGTITLDRSKSLNAITAEDYDEMARALRELDGREDTLVTILQATGKWFCAGTDVKGRTTGVAHPESVREAFIGSVVRTALDCTQALYSHRKILVAALNGPVMGIASAFLGQFDFIYCMPNAWLSVPFTFLGIVAEAGSSVSFVNRMGLGKANETLLWGRKQEASDLLSCGFVNKIFEQQSAESFHASVRDHVLHELDGLDPTALLKVKSLIKTGLNEKNDPDATNMREAYAQAERFTSGIPAEKFAKIATGQIRHKL